MRNSECFEHDIAVRNAWVEHLTEDDKVLLRGDQKTNAGGVEKTARFELYREIDQMVKTQYLDELRESNKDQVVIHIKGFGPVRQAKDQLPTDMRLSSVASDVIASLNLIEMIKPKPIAVESVSE